MENKRKPNGQNPLCFAVGRLRTYRCEQEENHNTRHEEHDTAAKQARIIVNATGKISGSRFLIFFVLWRYFTQAINFVVQSS